MDWRLAGSVTEAGGRTDPVYPPGRHTVSARLAWVTAASMEPGVHDGSGSTPAAAFRASQVPAGQCGPSSVWPDQPCPTATCNELTDAGPVVSVGLVDEAVDDTGSCRCIV